MCRLSWPIEFLEHPIYREPTNKFGGGDRILIRVTSTRLCAEGGLVDRVREAMACIFLYNSIRCTVAIAVVRERFLNFTLGWASVTI
jgi:hypothetical protein